MYLQTGAEMQLQSFPGTALNSQASAGLLQVLGPHLTGISICPLDFSVRADIMSNETCLFHASPKS